MLVCASGVCLLRLGEGAGSPETGAGLELSSPAEPLENVCDAHRPSPQAAG